MSQTWNLPIAGSSTVSAWRTIINDFGESLRTNFSGATAPGSPVKGQFFYDTDDDSIWVYQGAAWVLWLPDAKLTGGGFIRKDGSVAMTAALNLGSQKITAVASGTASTDGVNKGQVDSLARITSLHLGTISAGPEEKMLFSAAGIAATILEIYLSNENGVVSDVTNLWTFQVRNLTAGNNLRSTAKSTNGNAITADTLYALGLDQNLGLAANDVLELQLTRGGAPNNLQELCVYVKYRIDAP